jgi:predicted kinase
MKKVIIPRGIPGSGKTTWVKAELAKHEPGTAVRISNDDLSHMLYGQPWGKFFFSDTTRDTLHKLRISMLETFLKQDGITHIYVDNTNLAVPTVNSLQQVAVRHGAEVIVDDRFLTVDFDECVARDATRDVVVGEDVIRKMYGKAKHLKPWKTPHEIPVIEKYDNDQTGASSAIIVDIDGTLAHMDGRSPYDYDLVKTDIVDENVRYVVNQMYKNMTVIIMSGRSDDSMEVTEDWLKDNDIRYNEIYMRKTGDYRPDWIVKNELFQAHVAGRFRIRFVLDDRDQVVDLWRRKLGLPTWQVADGDF